jgi:F-box protein 11
MVEVCTIQGNSYTGVEVREGGYPSLRQCTIRSNGYQGVWVYGDSRASVEDCDLTSNKQGAFRVDPGARVIRKGNRE